MKIKKFITVLAIVAFVFVLSAFATSCKKRNTDSESDSVSTSDTAGPIDSGKTSEKEEFSDVIVPINGKTITVPEGEGYLVKNVTLSETDGVLRFEVEIFDDYSKDLAVVTVNGNVVTGQNGAYETTVSGDKADIKVTGVKRLYASVGYVSVKGVTYDGANKVLLGEALEFTVRVDANAVVASDFKVAANGKEVSVVNGKHRIENVTENLQIVALGVDYPKFSVTIDNGDGYTLKVNSTEIYKGETLLVSIDIDEDYVLESEPKVYSNGMELTKNENGVYEYKNVSGNVTVTASGIKKTSVYTVSFKNIDEEYPDVEVAFGNTVDGIEDPEKDGRTFKGWRANGGEVVTLDNYAITGDTEFFAVWTYHYKDANSRQTEVHAFTKEEALKIGETVPSGRVGYGKGDYQQKAEWEAFRVFDDKEGGAFSVTFPTFDYKKYGYVEFKFSTIWSTKTISYNGVKLASVTNGGNLNNYLEIFVSEGYIGCGNVKIPLKEGVYEGTSSLVLDVDNGKGRHGVFSDFYTYEYDYDKVIAEILKTDGSETKEEAQSLIAKFKKCKNFLTDEEKVKYSTVFEKATALKRIAMPMTISDDGSFVSATVNGETRNPNNANETPGGAPASSMGSCKRWTLTNVTEIILRLQTIELDADEKLEYKIAFQSGSFPYTVSIGGEIMVSANTNFDVITIAVCGNGTVKVSCEKQGVTKTITAPEGDLTVKIEKGAEWGNMYVSHTVTLGVSE